jgi:hypothetical protein
MMVSKRASMADGNSGPSFVRVGPPGMEVTMPMSRFMSDLSPVMAGSTTRRAEPEPCSCGDRSRPNINHRKRIPCWTYLGHDRHDIDKKGRIIG